MTRRWISFANATVAVDANDTHAQALVDFLFRFTIGSSTQTPDTTFSLAADSASNQFILHRDGEWVRQDSSPAESAEFLLGEVTYRLLDHSRGGVTLHAGALAWHGNGILIPGAIGAGKTTLTAWLTHRGLDYLTDEMVWLAQGALDLHPFTRPLNVKATARRVMETFFDYARHADQVLRGADVDLILPTALRPTNRLSTPPLRLILFPQFQPATTPHCERLSPAQAGLALASTLLNVGNLNDRGFAQIAQLARSAPAFHLRYSRLEQIEPELIRLLNDTAASVPSRLQP